MIESLIWKKRERERGGGEKPHAKTTYHARVNSDKLRITRQGRYVLTKKKKNLFRRGNNGRLPFGEDDTSQSFSIFFPIFRRPSQRNAGRRGNFAQRARKNITDMADSSSFPLLIGHSTGTGRRSSPNRQQTKIPPLRAN